ncbi:MAG: transporter substrate-binding domain-containing protein [Pseudomonadota bacterium]|uniref:transporter substrate-binding domain-containing protein n=1 Tax=Thalassovita sp. TaxID=1979401 RepID=UPI002AB04D10|nr:transporter substrate-binding domain-containing protein [Thalassovita sp.]MEC8039149.1 transporter substrate-binding domain-containing protein [Pseudomonadota bacterium]MEC8294635.1 transporter substrate-binding domain-containing protein [Pseudomonadota bacterium]
MKNLILSTAVLALTAGVAAAETVRLGTEGAYPPYNFLNDAGEVDGFERELGDELCKRAELTCEWVTNDWDSIIPNLTSGNYDAIIAGMSITDERKEVVDFTQGYTQPSPSAYAALAEGVDVNSAIVAAQSSTIQSGHVATTGATLVEFPTPDETVAAVKSGEVDAVLSDKDYLNPIVAEGGLVFIGDVYLGGGIGMAFRKSDADLRGKFDAAIASMKADGSLNALLDKWEIEGKF